MKRKSENKKILFIIIAITTLLTIIFLSKNAIFRDQKAFKGETYIACGCGCCGGAVPENKCLYYAKGDDLNKIKEEDKKTFQSPQCATIGCSMGIKYGFCD